MKTDAAGRRRDSRWDELMGMVALTVIVVVLGCGWGPDRRSIERISSPDCCSVQLISGQ